jgi:hypothetical protein
MILVERCQIVQRNACRNKVPGLFCRHIARIRAGNKPGSLAKQVDSPMSQKIYLTPILHNDVGIVDRALNVLQYIREEKKRKT